MRKNQIATIMVFLIIATLLLNNTNLSLEAQGTSISFQDINLNLDDVNNYNGVRMVVFFSHTCYACKEEVSTLKEIDDNYNITIFMLNIYQASNNDSLVAFKDEMEISDLWILGFITDETGLEFNITTIPTIIILDDLGRIVADILGTASYSFLEKCIVNAIEHNTDEYFTERREDPGSKLDVIFIVIGVIVTAIVLYFLVKSFPPKEKNKT